jgi:hypothetical protein
MPRTIRALTALVAAVFFSLAYPSLAQKAGPNGGKLAGKAGHETELVVGPTELVVYLIDHGKPHSVKGVSLRAVIQQEGGASTTVAFAPADDKKLVAKLSAPLSKGAIVVLTGKDDHRDAIASRYVID